MGPDVWKLSSQMSDEQRSSLHLSVKPTTSFLSLSSSSSYVTKYVFLYVIMWPVLSRFGNACVSFSDYFHTCPFPFYSSFAYSLVEHDILKISIRYLNIYCKDYLKISLSSLCSRYKSWLPDIFLLENIFLKI